MSINDDQTSDLPHESDLDSSITPPKDTAPVPPSATIVPPEPAAGHVIPSDEEMTKLVNPETPIEVVSDAGARVVDLKEIEETIIGQESIAAAQVAGLQERFGNIVTESITEKMFTAVPTKTNYSHVLRAMRTKIAQEEAELNGKWLAYRNSAVLPAVQFFESAANAFIPALRSIVVHANFMAQCGLEKANREDFERGTYKGEIFDLSKLDFQTLDVQGLGSFAELQESQHELAIKAVDGIKEIFKHQHFKCFILAANDNKDFEYCMSHNMCADYHDCPITCGDIVKFYANPNLDVYLDGFAKYVQDSKDIVDKALDVVDSDKSESIIGFMVQTAPDINHRLLQSTKLLSGWSYLTQAVDVLVHLLFKF